MHGVQNIARFAVGIVGNIISLCLFLAPVPTFWRIYKKKSTEEFHPYPYLVTCLNCIFWIFYGMPWVHPDSVLVVTINSVGLAIEIFYLCVFFYYTTYEYRRNILLVILVEAVIFGAVAAPTLLCAHTHGLRSFIIGAICVGIGIAMYASPLTIIWKVMKTKSPEFLPFWLCLAGFLNGITWFTYANLKKFDPFIATGNGVGALLGLSQLLVYGYYKRRAKKSGAVQDDAKTGDVQLEKQNDPTLPPV